MTGPDMEQPALPGGTSHAQPSRPAPVERALGAAGAEQPRALAVPGRPPLLAALLQPATYPHAADDLRLYETHISWVVLAGAYAYKLKKPVDLGFLDFSTVERRADACADEVRLNRRLSPDVYLGVAHLCLGRQGYTIDGPGEPVEPLVKMRRLPEEGMLPRLLAVGAVDARLVRRIARTLARFHATAATGPGVDEYGSIDTVRANWEQNFAQSERFAGRTLPACAGAAVAVFVNDFLETQSALFAQRRAAGRVREGHGDLHAASICVEGQRVRIFDCIEFSPRYRCSDVAADVAFLAMDLEHHGRADLAAQFVDTYVRASGDHELRRLLRFYGCYRAFVRGKVLSFRLDEPGLAPREEARRTAEARAYFELAWAYARRRDRPLLVATMGLPASGKTTLAQTLARRLGLVYLSSDILRKERAGVRPGERQHVPFGQGVYSSELTRRTYAALRRRAGAWLRAGRGVVVDATFGRPEQRRALVALAKRAPAQLVALYCQADEATLVARLAAREGEPGAVSDARLEIWPALRNAFVAPHELAELITLDATAAPEAVAEQAVAALLG